MRTMLVFLCSFVCAVAQARTPNIVLIIVDDLGYADLSVHGSNIIETPNIDRIANEGVRLINGYVNAPICAPTRAALMTGRYQQRCGYVDFTGPTELQIETDRGVPTDNVLLAAPLQKAGYATGAIGKWHLGINEKYRPLSRGFDEFFGFLPGGHEFFQWTSERAGPIYRDAEPVDGEGYLTEAFSDEAVRFIERHSKEPFFLYVSYNAVHFPYEVPPEYLDRVGDLQLPEGLPEKRAKSRKICLAMGIAMDEGIGKILSKLDDLDLADDTMVVFINDNGGVMGVSDNRPFRGGKVSVYEGGIRVPFFIRYPPRIEAGTMFEHVVSGMDLYPTFVALAGGELPKGVAFDGVNLMPYLIGKKAELPHPVHFWRLGGAAAVRKGDLKLVVRAPARKELYNLADDPGERNDLAAKFPDEVADMTRLLADWDAQMPPPGWNRSKDRVWMEEYLKKHGITLPSPKAK